MRLRIVATATAVLALGLLSACSSQDTDPKVASVSESPGQSTRDNTAGGDGDGAVDMDALRKYAKCMRDNGVEMSDPQQQGDGAIVLPQVEGTGDSAKEQKAQEACKDLLPNGGEPAKPNPEELDEQREFAKCMREHGVDMPDPDPNGGAQPGLPMDEKTEAAAKACGAGEPTK